MTKKLLVTSALPYANGSIHIGHLVEYIQTDVWVRFHNHIGNTCHYMCADDTHGTPIMITAKNRGISPEDLIKTVREEHMADFAGFHIKFDNYYSTHSPENQALAEDVYLKAKANGAIYSKDVEQAYCPSCAMFLPDRFIRGICPTCKADDQYGDSCEKCSATYSPTDLISARCANCGTAPITKTSEHYFFKLSQFESQLKEWLNENHVADEIRNKLQEWFVSGLKDWDISRDEPYFGFKIPGTENKYFYVWLDAPVGYMASTKNWCDRTKEADFDNIWRNGEYEVHHFIGKDITYFHTLFWPAMLMVSGYTLPTFVHIHGFLTVNGEKMSKSRGTFILARKYLDHLNPEFLRYYFSSKLSGTVEDLDLNFEDFVNKVNSDVVNKFVNIASRLGSIVTKKLDGRLTTLDEEGHALLAQIKSHSEAIKAYYEDVNTHKALSTVMACADIANKFIDEKAPWSAVKESPEKAAAICTAGLNALRLLSIYLKPVIPTIVAGVETFLDISPLTWKDLETTLESHAIKPYEHLAQRVEMAQVEALVQS